MNATLLISAGRKNDHAEQPAQKEESDNLDHSSNSVPLPPCGNAFFSSPERIEKLHLVALSWIGTPFHPHGRVKGHRGGVSCESLALSIAVETGWLPADVCKTFPRGSLRHWRTHRKSLIVPFIEHELAAVLVGLSCRSTFQPGDVIWFTDANTEHLGTVLVGTRSTASHSDSSRDGVESVPTFIHALLPDGVQHGRLDDATFLSRIERAWRPITTV